MPIIKVLHAALTWFYCTTNFLSADASQWALLGWMWDFLLTLKGSCHHPALQFSLDFQAFWYSSTHKCVFPPTMYQAIHLDQCSLMDSLRKACFTSSSKSSKCPFNKTMNSFFHKHLGKLSGDTIFVLWTQTTFVICDRSQGPNRSNSCLRAFFILNRLVWCNETWNPIHLISP